MSKSYWFAEVDPVSNEHLAEVLKYHGVGIEAEEHGRIDTEGKPHDVWSIPSEFVTRLRKAKRLDDRRAFHQFKFFVASTPDGLLRLASFVEKQRRPKSVQKVSEDLRKISKRKRVNSDR